MGKDVLLTPLVVYRCRVFSFLVLWDGGGGTAMSRPKRKDAQQ